MTTILPQSPTPPPNTGPAVTVTIPNPPPALVQLPTGAVIDAQVVANLDKGLTELNTALGKLEIKTNVSLPENTKIELQILRQVPQTQLMIKALNDQPIQTTGNAEKIGAAIKAAIQATLKSIPTPASPPSPEISAAKINPATTPIKLDIGALIKATLLRPIGTPTSGPQNAVATAGSTNAPTATPSALSSDPASASKPVKNAAAAKQSVQASAVKPEISGNAQNRPLTTPVSDENGHNAKTGKPAQIRAGTNYNLRFLGVSNTPQNPAQASAQSAAQGAQAKAQTAAQGANPQSSGGAPAQNVINGIVVATTPTGQPILNTPLGMMALETKLPISPGQSLSLEVISSQMQATSALSAEARFDTIFQSREWPNLADAIRQIGLNAPAVSQKIVGSTLPQPNTQLTTNILFFLNALKGGDLQSWIGNAATALLDQTSPDLLGQLDEDFFYLGRAFSEPQSNDWRTAIVPFFDGMGLEQFQMHTRGQLNEGEDGKKEDGSRFVIDIVLSNLGRFQLDGFVRTKRKRLDLVVRTEKSLPAQMRSDINKIFTDFSEASGVAGQITFQADQKFVEISIPQMNEYSNKDVTI